MAQAFPVTHIAQQGTQRSESARFSTTPRVENFSSPARNMTTGVFVGALPAL
jgi:hypothetical protein